MKKAPSSSHRTNTQRAHLRSDASLILQASHLSPLAISNLENDQIMGMVNTGLDDFSIEKDGVCLSLIMAIKFFAITETLKTMESPSYRVEAGQILKTRKLHKELQNELGDVLYVYKKLRDNPKGLNWNLLNAYQQKYPDAQLPLLLDQMDHYQLKNQNKSFNFSPKTRQRGARVSD